MAGGFFKKVFSFGKKEVEERPAEDEPLAPINWAALDTLKEAPPPRSSRAQPGTDLISREQPTPIEPPAPPERPPAPPEPAPAKPEPEIIPEPVRPEVEPTPQEVPGPPSPAPGETPGPAPVEIPTPPAPPAPQPPAPEHVPEPPVPQPAPVPPEIPAEPPMPSVPPAPTAGKVTVAKKVEPKAAPVVPAPPAPRTTWFQRLREGLARSSKELSGNIAGVFTRKKLDEETLQDLEDVLIRADLGMETALRVTDALSASRYGRDVSDADVRAIMAVEIEKVLRRSPCRSSSTCRHKPHVILVVGVNGTGKTTTIGKLAAKLSEGGLKVMLAAGDTFRAAAIEQLKIWGERTGSPVVASKLGADASGLAWDAFEKAREAGSDVLIIDTAGRLQNRAELMAELEKIVRVLGKHDPDAPHTVLQTVDATTGQNALNQVEIFRNVAGVSGLVMTKLDGTARGGILVAIAAKHKLPVYFIGVGEQVDDLEPFSASDFAKAIAGVA